MRTLATILTDAFVAIIGRLRPTVAAEARRSNTHAPTPAAIQDRVGRLGRRLVALLDLHIAGKLPPPQPAAVVPRAASRAPLAPRPRAGSPHPDSRPPRMPPASVPWPATGLGHLLPQEHLADFIAAAPQASRTLRSLCRMLRIVAPPMLALAPRAPACAKPQQLRLSEGACVEPAVPAAEASAAPVAVSEPSCVAEGPTLVPLRSNEVLHRTDAVCPPHQEAATSDAKNRD